MQTSPSLQTSVARLASHAARVDAVLLPAPKHFEQLPYGAAALACVVAGACVVVVVAAFVTAYAPTRTSFGPGGLLNTTVFDERPKPPAAAETDSAD